MNAASIWRSGQVFTHNIGFVRTEEQNGRRFWYARVDFPEGFDLAWWPRTTEASSLDEARDWIDEQSAEWMSAFKELRTKQALSPEDQR